MHPNKSLEILKPLVTELAKTPFQGTAIGPSLAFTRKILKLTKFEGTNDPIAFLGEGICAAIKRFVDSTSLRPRGESKLKSAYFGNFLFI